MINPNAAGRCEKEDDTEKQEEEREHSDLLDPLCSHRCALLGKHPLDASMRKGRAMLHMAEWQWRYNEVVEILRTSGHGLSDCCQVQMYVLRDGVSNQILGVSNSILDHGRRSFMASNSEGRCWIREVRSKRNWGKCRVSVMGGDAADGVGRRRSDQRWMGTIQEAVTCGRFMIITGDRKPALLHTGMTWKQMDP